MMFQIGLSLAERGLVPLTWVRWGIRRLLVARLNEQRAHDNEAVLREAMDAAPIAYVPEKANEQHYEVPPAFFQLVLGPHMKYSSALWSNGTRELVGAEERMLAETCQRARIEDGQTILDLGCGWGSLSLYVARRFPNSRIVSVSNSVPQRRFLESRAPSNVTVITADMNTFDTPERFDRVVSIEMFEHMRNYRVLLRQIASWLRPDGKLFIHIFCHRRFAYAFETNGAANWMGRHFFTGGIMPSADLLLSFADEFALEQRWLVNGTHYARTAAAWRSNLETHRDAALPILEKTYGTDSTRWFHRWRLFFLACEELFGYEQGLEWLVAHYLLSKS